jgi:hypothetical protein
LQSISKANVCPANCSLALLGYFFNNKCNGINNLTHNMTVIGEDNQQGISINLYTFVYYYCASAWNVSAWQVQGTYSGSWKLGVGLSATIFLSLKMFVPFSTPAIGTNGTDPYRHILNRDIILIINRYALSSTTTRITFQSTIYTSIVANVTADLYGTYSSVNGNGNTNGSRVNTFTSFVSSFSNSLVCILWYCKYLYFILDNQIAFNANMNYSVECTSALPGTGSMTLFVGDSHLFVSEVDISFWHCAAVGQDISDMLASNATHLYV